VSAILKDILSVVVPTLRAKGYKGSGRNYRLASEKTVSVVNFQKSSGGERFYVNVGVQPLFVPTECGTMPVAKKIKEPECIFRTRLDPMEEDLLGWPYSMDVSENLVARFDTLYEKKVAPLMAVPGPVTEASVQDFPSDSIHPLLGARRARNFLHFARISLAMGNRSRAAEFATAAIEICPPRASSLRCDLRDVLAKANS